MVCVSSSGENILGKQNEQFIQKDPTDDLAHRDIDITGLKSIIVLLAVRHSPSPTELFYGRKFRRKSARTSGDKRDRVLIYFWKSGRLPPRLQTFLNRQQVQFSSAPDQISRFCLGMGGESDTQPYKRTVPEKGTPSSTPTGGQDFASGGLLTFRSVTHVLRVRTRPKAVRLQPVNFIVVEVHWLQRLDRYQCWTITVQYQ